jgi:subtilisin family serine protease
MRARRNALFLVAAVAALTAVSTGVAGAKNRLGGGGFLNSHGGNPPSTNPMPPPDRGGGHQGGGHHGGWHPGGGWNGPGIIVGIPPGGQVIDDGPVQYVPHRTKRPRKPRQRTTTVQRGPSGAPPANEHRYVPDEVVIEVANSVSTAQIDALQNRFRLARIESYRFQLSDTTVFRWRIPDRRSVAAVVRALEGDAVVASASPNYLFTLQQSNGKSASEGDPAQYALAKLRLPQAHTIAKGDGILVAVIDSAIDGRSPDLAGSIAGSFDTLKTPMKPDKHGTAIAGLIAGHGKLMGAAPNAKIIAVRAFDPAGERTQGTTFNILKGIDWAAAGGARVINMSFAGPNDPALHRSIEAAHAKGIVLVAAAGNAGAKSPPLYPAADPKVIAVTATTVADKLFALSNRGRHIDVAAPGEQILVPLPGGGYDVSSGTSYAAAEVSGIIALMLQREPTLSPAKVRYLLMTTAIDLGPKGRDSQFGAGLADAYRALAKEKPPLAQARPVKRETTGQR